MSDESSSGEISTPNTESNPRRRQLIKAAGVAAIPALAGCSGPGSGDATPTADQASGEVDPRFGYVGTGDESPPVEADHTVELLIQEREGPIPEFYFEPAGLAIDMGDTVRFDLSTPHHNINAYHPAFGYTQRVPDQVAPFSSPILAAGDYWLYTFEQEGVHDLMCAPHELYGMVGRIVVGSATGPGANPVGEAPAPSEESRPPEFTAGLVLSDPAMSPENVADSGSVSWGEIADENKRLLLQPVEQRG
jgi:plastocyanin